MNDVIDYYQHKEDSTDYAVTSDSKKYQLKQLLFIVSQ